VRLLVTGGAGFIGSTFVRRRLSTNDDEIVVLDKLTYAGSRANLADLEADPTLSRRLRFVEGDIADPEIVNDLVSSSDAVINFAAESHVDRSIIDSSAFLRTGVLGLHTILEAARAAEGDGDGARSIRVVQVSTDEVYGPVITGDSREEDRLDPRSPYSAAKAAGELLVKAYGATYGLDVVITRGANTYGPRQHPEKFIPLFITNAIDDQPLPLYGDGQQRRDWLHVDDHADAVGFLLDHGETGGVYNVCRQEERTNREVAERVLGELSKPWSLVRTVPDRPAHDRRYAIDPSRLHALGWSAQVPFEQGLRDTVRWYSDNPAWWRALRDGAWDRYYEHQYGWRLAQSVEA